MPQHYLKVNGTRGELNPLAASREDIELYKASFELLRNFVVLKEGGIRRRSVQHRRHGVLRLEHGTPGPGGLASKAS